MSENKHTPEPWRVEIGEQPESIALLCTSGLAHFEIVSDSQLGDIHADARRIVACVNACEDILDYELSLGCVARLSEQLRTITKQRDELLAATEAIAINSEECLDRRRYNSDSELPDDYEVN